MAQPIAIITGGSRGLGRSTALKMATKGIGIILTYHTQKADAEDVVGLIQHIGGKAVALQLDVARSEDFPDFFEKVRETLHQNWQQKTFSILVNNAGMGVHAAFADTTEAQFDSLVNTHFKGPFFLTQTLLPLIADGGSIVNLSSGLARFSLPGYAAYASMKGAMEVLSRYQAKELGSRGIRVNTVAPGAIATDFGGGAVRDNADLNAFVASQTALGRVGQADDIGEMIAALVGNENRWVNAQRIEVSGGMFV